MRKNSHHITTPLSQEVLLAYLAGHLSSNDKKRVDAIIAAEPYYKEVLEGLRWVDDDYPLSDKLSALQEKIHQQHYPETTTTFTRLRRYRWLAAASIATLILSIGIWTTTFTKQSTPVLAERIQSAEALRTPNLERTTPEGSAPAPPPVQTTQQHAPAPAPASAPPPQPTEEPTITVLADEEFEDDEIAEVSSPDEAVQLSSIEVVEQMPEQGASKAMLTAPANDAMYSKQGTSLSTRSMVEVTINPLAEPWTLYKEGKFRKAIRKVTPILQSMPSQEGYWLLAQAQLGLSDTAAAIEQLRQAALMDGPYKDTIATQLLRLDQ